MQPQITYASLFSSAGIGCHGFNLEGYTCVATAELLARRLEVQKANNICADPGAYYLGDLSDKNFLSRISDEVNARTKDLTFVLATPPCQGMSIANHKKGDELLRNSLVVNSLLFIEATNPRFFVLENVRAFLTSVCTDTDGQERTINEAIDLHLGGKYNILKRVVNLKDYGSPSSRTRTLVIGVRCDLHDTTPLDLFPDAVTAPNLKSLIGDLPALSEMGEIEVSDVYHSFRPYDPRMRPWISALTPGQSAFDNTEANLRPHRVLDGKLVENRNGNGDKYRRNVWEKVAPCVHTRNDILASQATIHPSDDRVFSIRELCRMMGVPESFRWANFELSELNSLPLDQKRAFLKEHDTNIRQCLGEGVPTPVFQSIAKKAKRLLADNCTSNFAASVAEYEESNPRKRDLAAYYTRQDIAYSLLSLVPARKSKKPYRVLEPSVGVGAFIPQIIGKFQDRPLHIDVIDIDNVALQQAKVNYSGIDHEGNVEFRALEGDFLTMGLDKKYDLIVGNPPFGSSGKVDERFRIKDLYAKFLARSLELADYVAFVIPKSFLGGNEFKALRSYIRTHYRVIAIEDYGETAFKDINIETVGLVVATKEKATDHTTIVRSRLFGSYEQKPLDAIASSDFPSWLLYRDWFFDAVVDQLEFNCFQAYRDRKLTRSRLSSSDPTPVMRAKDIQRDANPEPVNRCAAELVPLSFWALTQGKECLVVPNLSYYPRASRLPAETYVDGSAAVLVPSRPVDTAGAIEFFGSADFFYFYRIARNFSVRSLNVDSLSVHYWGVPTGEYESVLPNDAPVPSSKSLFRRFVQT